MKNRKLGSGFSLAITVAIMAVVIAVATVLSTFIVSRVYADRTNQKQTEQNFVAMQFEYDFCNYSKSRFVQHLENYGILEVEETAEFDTYYLENIIVKIDKDYLQLWVNLKSEDNKQILFLKTDVNRKIIEKQT